MCELPKNVEQMLNWEYMQSLYMYIIEMICCNAFE